MNRQAFLFDQSTQGAAPPASPPAPPQVLPPAIPASPQQAPVPFGGCDSGSFGVQGVQGLPAVPQQQPPLQPQPQPAEPAVAVAPEPTDSSRPEILAMLKVFAKKENCSRYSGDSEKIKLLTDYLWLRQLDPILSFDEFLQRYEAVADFDAENLKHPADAIKHLLPRNSKTVADGQRKWSAKEVVDYVSLYVDMIRAAEDTGTAIPMSFRQFCECQPLIDRFVAGEFASQSPVATPRKKEKITKPAEAQPVTTSGQRCTYNHIDGRTLRGYACSVTPPDERGYRYVDFQSDDGERYDGVAITKFEFSGDPPPQPPEDPATLEPVPTAAVLVLKVPRAEMVKAVQALSMNEPMGNVEVGANVYYWHMPIPDTAGMHVCVCVVNGAEPGPYVDAFVCKDTPDNIIAEVPPRDTLPGVYRFVTDNGVYEVEVKST